MITFGRILDKQKGIGPGFDFLRIALALSIVCFHALTVTGHYYPLDDTPVWMIHYALVPMFFALSGFLVTASATRLSLKNFLLNRGLRIVPALAVDTLVCALIVGPLFTTWALRSYFRSDGFRAYFLNMIGWVHFTLPGVFEHYPVARVNGSLWTVPFELACYGLISILIISGSIRRRYDVATAVVAYLLAATLAQMVGVDAMTHSAIVAKALNVVFIDYEAQAVTAFLCGIVAYQNRDRIPYHPVLFAAAGSLLLAIALLLPQRLGQLPILRFVLMPLITYLTVFIGLSTIRMPKLLTRGDYSYGIYLYHQPFLQIVFTLFPAIAIVPHFGAGLTFLAALPLILGVAYLSWHLVEKPTLALRKRFSMVARLRDLETHDRSKPAILARAGIEQ